MWLFHLRKQSTEFNCVLKVQNKHKQTEENALELQKNEVFSRFCCCSGCGIWLNHFSGRKTRKTHLNFYRSMNFQLCYLVYPCFDVTEVFAFTRTLKFITVLKSLGKFVWELCELTSSYSSLSW